MKALFPIALLAAMTVGEDTAAQPSAGSRLPPDKNSCATCHGEQDLWDEANLRLFVPTQPLADDVHWKNGVNCHDCHGGDPASLNFRQAHATEVDGPPSQVRPFIPPISQPTRTPERLEAQVQVCGKCHARASETYLVSVHGHGFRESGLVVTAICTDCHGHHGIFPKADPRSALHEASVGTTCATCHQFIQERLQHSVHGQAAAPPDGTEKTAIDVEEKRKPSCTDCHEGHDRPHPRSTAFRLGIPDSCGNCHANRSNSYTRSLHGQLTELGYVPAAKCSDCHGAHDILPISVPASRLSAIHRRGTCTKCHADASDNFLNFDPHADPQDAQRDSILHWVDVGLTGLLIGVFTVFGLHSCLWLVRGLIHVIKRGRPKHLSPGALAYVRFRPVHRAAHAVLVVSFLGLALTGLPLKYSHAQWAQTLSWAFGGFASTGLWHRISGLVNVGCLVFYVVWFAAQWIIRSRNGVGGSAVAFGPDSPVPNRRDLSDIGRMLRWFVGRGPKPTFERWAYWEKFDLWGASADIILIGSTGFILWFPSQFCALLPGQTLNVADLIHGKLALLATGFVFAIHFFSANLRPEKFPMDICIITGLVSQEEMQDERPELIERLRSTGRLEQTLTKTPSRSILLLAKFAGAVALVIGLALLTGILLAAL
jgi:cytochrome b subunit of formate dehydrogenase